MGEGEGRGSSRISIHCEKYLPKREPWKAAKVQQWKEEQAKTEAVTRVRREQGKPEEKSYSSRKLRITTGRDHYKSHNQPKRNTVEPCRYGYM